jgi:hypothetical protein
MTHNDVMPGEQIKSWGSDDYRGLSTTAPLYHALLNIDSKSSVRTEIRVFSARILQKTGVRPVIFSVMPLTR